MDRTTRRGPSYFGVLAWLSLFWGTIFAVADESKDYALMGRATWSAFVCATLASAANLPKEQERLFQFGYEQGQKYIAALKANKITREDASREVPIAMLLFVGGPTSEFILGRMFERATDSAMKNVAEVGGQYVPTEQRPLLASNEFTRMNCRLIGTR